MVNIIFERERVRHFLRALRLWKTNLQALLNTLFTWISPDDVICYIYSHIKLPEQHILAIKAWLGSSLCAAMHSAQVMRRLFLETRWPWHHHVCQTFKKNCDENLTQFQAFVIDVWKLPVQLRLWFCILPFNPFMYVAAKTAWLFQ